MSEIVKKTLDNTDMELNNPVGVFGNPGAWVCICKAWCDAEDWMKSTKAMDVEGGCLVQVSTQQGANVAEALTFVPNMKVEYFA